MFNDFKISFPILTSLTGSSDKDTLIVSPIPSINNIPKPIEDLILPGTKLPDSVIPKCKGYSVIFDNFLYAPIDKKTSDDFTLTLKLKNSHLQLIFIFLKALSTKASGQGSLYFSKISFSS